jgi:hypothetical protein
MVRLRWVQHLMAGSRLPRDSGKNTERALAARARSRFLAALRMTDRKAKAAAEAKATAKTEADSQRE